MSFSKDKIIKISRSDILFVADGAQYRVTGEALLISYGSNIDFLVNKNSLYPIPDKGAEYAIDVLSSLLNQRGITFEIS